MYFPKVIISQESVGTFFAEEENYTRLTTRLRIRVPEPGILVTKKLLSFYEN